MLGLENMKIVTNSISFNARIMIMPQGTTNKTKQNLSENIRVLNKHKKQSFLSKFMTYIIRPYLKSILKDPS